MELKSEEDNQSLSPSQLRGGLLEYREDFFVVRRSESRLVQDSGCVDVVPLKWQKYRAYLLE